MADIVPEIDFMFLDINNRILGKMVPEISTATAPLYAPPQACQR
jgi:hypothetical protein